jgi:hypothetical protein
MFDSIISDGVFGASADAPTAIGDKRNAMAIDIAMIGAIVCLIGNIWNLKI